MPIYEYRCGKCGKIFEVVQFNPVTMLQACPHCNTLSDEKLVSKPGYRRDHTMLE